MKKYKKNILMLILIVTGIFVFSYGFTFAKYISNSVWDYYLKSKGFYFSSDHLDTDGATNINSTWDGGRTNFNLKNSMNGELITDYDINYTATCTITGDASSIAECRMNGTTSNTVSGVLSTYQSCNNTTGDSVDVSSFNKMACELDGYDWISQVSASDLYFDIVLTDDSDEISDVTVNVTVTSTSPYRKTLSGSFILNKGFIEEDIVTVDYKDYSTNGRLTVTNNYISDRCVTVRWDADELLISEDKDIFNSYNSDTNGYINEIKININGKSSASYIFYKRDINVVYKVTSFDIQDSNSCE